MTDLIGLVTGRRWLIAAVSLALVGVIACESGSGSDVAAPAIGQSATADGTPNADASAGDQAPLTGEIAAPADGGINEECVQRVLGRQASGFGDVTAAERDRILSECTGDDGARRAGATGGFQFGGDVLAALDPDCVQGIVGDIEVDFTQMTPEQRQSVFQECGSGDGRTGGFGGGLFGQDRLAGQLPDCAIEALGRTLDDLRGLTQEDLQAITAACGDQLDGLGGGGRFGGGAGGFRGGFLGQGGATGQLPECVTEALRAASGDLQSLTPEDFQAITDACGDQFGGFGGFGGGGFFGQGGGQ